MHGSLRLGKLSGIDVFVHWSLWVLLLLFGVICFASTRDMNAIAMGGSSVVLLFGCVVLHELGHALAARRFGIRTRDITLLPVGGVARLERLPTEAKQELSIALAGPAMNLAVFTATIALGGLLFGFGHLALSETLVARVFRMLLAFNGIMAVFNLLPIFPMDGGRVLRSILSMFWSATKATRIAAFVGQVLAIGLGIIGLVVLKNPLMLFLSGYLIFAARRESQAVSMMHRTASLQVRHAMAAKYVCVSPFESIARATRLLSITQQRLLPIARDGDYFGALTVERIVDVYNEGLQDVPTIEVLDEEVPVVSPSDSLQVVCKTMRATGFHTLPVVNGTWLIGVISRDSIAETVRSNREQSKSSTKQGKPTQTDAHNAPTV